MGWLLTKQQRRLDLSISEEARVEDLVPYFEKILLAFNPSVATMEAIFDTLFHSSDSLPMRIIDVAKLLLPYRIELNTRLLGGTQEMNCEITGCYRFSSSKMVRVLHYLSDGACGLSQVIILN